MRKFGRLMLILAVMLVLLSPSAAVLARAGGSTGGGGGATGGGGTGGSSYGGGGYGASRTYHRVYFFGRSYGYYGSSPVSIMVSFVFLGVILYPNAKRFLRRKRAEYAAPRETEPASTELEDEFSALFYKVEEAWSQNDQATLERVMSPHYFAKQKRILDGYRRQRKADRMESVAIVAVEEELTGHDDQVHIAVTAQARDYFEYFDKNAAYNEHIHDEAMIERFVEVWEMHREDGQLILDNIRQV